ncbi:MAG: YdcF family protein [Acidobacteria bacterium]|nr:YdcF family protein [Acidobacteriota bacterium]
MNLRSKRTLALLSLVVLFCATLALLGGIYADALGSYLVPGSGAPPRGDIVVIRSYGLPPFDEFDTAARLLRQGNASHILAAFHKPKAYQRVLGRSGSQEEIIASFFEEQGIAGDRFSLVPVANVEPALVQDAATLEPILSELARKHSWKRVILVGRQFRMRRVLWTFREFSRHSSLDFVPYSIPLGDVPTETWWRSNDATNEVLSEYCKLLYFQFFRFRSREAGAASTGGLGPAAAR